MGATAGSRWTFIGTRNRKTRRRSNTQRHEWGAFFSGGFVPTSFFLPSFLDLPFPWPFRFKAPLPPPHPPTAYQLLRELAEEKVRVTPGSDSHYPGNPTGILKTNTEPQQVPSLPQFQISPGKNTKANKRELTSEKLQRASAQDSFLGLTGLCAGMIEERRTRILITGYSCPASPNRNKCPNKPVCREQVRVRLLLPFGRWESSWSKPGLDQTTETETAWTVTTKRGFHDSTRDVCTWVKRKTSLVTYKREREGRSSGICL